MINLTVNGVAYPYPQAGDLNWATGASAWASAVTSSMLSLSGGSFPLTAQVDFGPSFGIKALSLLTESANPSGTGVIKLSNADGIGWRNFANTADLLLSVNSSNQLLFNGAGLGAVSGTGNTTTIGLVLTTGTLTANINALSITDSLVSSTAAIAYSKLNLTGNIVNADVSASAAIAYSKLNLAGAVLNADLAGSIALSKLLPLTGYVSGAGTVAATDTVLGAFQKLNGNDTLAVQRAIVTTKGDILAASASSTVVRFPAGADGQVVVADSSQSLGLRYATLQQGLKNYVTNSNFENGSTTGWATFNTSLTGTAPYVPNGSPFGSSTSIAGIGVTTTNPLAGAYSLQISTNAAWAAGDGLTSAALPIDREDRSKVLSFKANYEVVSGSANLNVSGTSANSLHVYIWDTQSSTWIQPTGCYSMNAYTGQISGTFQTSAACTSVQLVIICANATAGAVTINFDDFSLGPQSQAIGVPVSDWTSFTPTGSHVANATYTGKWKRVGDEMLLKYNINYSGATTSAALTVNLPAGYTIDTNKLTSNTGSTPIGGVGRFSNLSDTWSGIYPAYNSTTSLAVNYAQDIGTGTGPNLRTITQAAPFAIASGTGIEFTATVPIAGWSSNTVMSSDTDTRVIAASYNLLSTTSQVAGTPLKYTNKFQDTNGSYNSSTGGYTAFVPGTYRFTVSGTYSATANDLFFYVNGASKGLMGTFNTSRTAACVEYPLNAGDVVTIVPNVTASTSGLDGFYSASRLSGPSIIAASESVSCAVSRSTAQSIATSTPTQIAFDTKDDDSHNAFNTSTSLFTAPAQGKYRITCTTEFASNATGFRGIDAVKSGSASQTKTMFLVPSSGTASAMIICGSTSFRLLAGDQLKINATQSCGAALNVGGSGSQYTHMCIERVGN